MSDITPEYKLKIQKEFADLTEKGFFWGEAYEQLAEKYGVAFTTIEIYMRGFTGIKNVMCAGCGKIFHRSTAQIRYCDDCNSDSKRNERYNKQRRDWEKKHHKPLRTRVNLPYRPYPEDCFQPIENIIMF